jgi:putative sigma-54 modulation protein
MEFLLRNAEGNLSAKDRDYAAKKLGKLDRYLQAATKVEIVHREEKHNHHQGHRIEITVFADGLFIRGEEHDSSIRAAIDKVAEKLETRLRKFKGRLIDRHRRKAPTAKAVAIAAEPPEPPTAPVFEVAERKAFRIKPMTLEEAALQLELLGHPFFVFLNGESGRVEVLYRRNDGKYGVLQPSA